MRKSMITFQFISTFAALIPFVDFSSASEYHQLTEEEQQIRSALFWFPFFYLFDQKMFCCVPFPHNPPKKIVKGTAVLNNQVLEIILD
jgi:hypothetical protein